jgi:hypothetical protein
VWYGKNVYIENSSGAGAGEMEDRSVTYIVLYGIVSAEIAQYCLFLLESQMEGDREPKEKATVILQQELMRA